MHGGSYEGEKKTISEANILQLVVLNACAFGPNGPATLANPISPDLEDCTMQLCK